jgi:type I restriction enzyme, S subunit
MIADLKGYPSMKDSGVPWLGLVPTHWGIPRLGALLRERRETNDDGRVTEVLSVMRERGVIPYAEKGNVGNKRSDDITRYKIVRPNDIVVNCMNVIIGSVGLSKYTGCLSPVYYVLVRRGPHDEPRYLNAYFQSKRFQLSLVRIGNGILAHRMRIPMELLKCEPFPNPPAAEQIAIVRFLDHMDRRIQRYIRAKKKLIGLLNEQKQAIIHRAVTRGLDPNVPLKPSGVEWLGDVPEHWAVRRLKAVLRSVDHRSSSGTETLLSLRRDHGVVVYAEHFSRPPQGATTVGFKLVEVGQLVVNRLQANNGLLFCSGLRGLVSPDYSVFEARSPVDMQYLGSLLRTAIYKVHFRREATGLGTGSAGFLRLYDDRLLETPVALPPAGEQARLMVSLHEHTASIDRAVERQQVELDLLREYRIRLIADVVTGKVDVREAAANLPDEAEEPDLPDGPEEIDDVEEAGGEGTESSVEEAEP